MDILKKIEQFREKEEKLKWEGTFAEYLEIVKEKPWVAQSAHSRVYHMIKDAGFEEVGGRKRYKFFSNELFGLEEALERLVEE
ncbi:MAG: protein prkA, partial [Bacillales bacterium]|nr:protein prkA [Bacillales bacterium]